jgi:hypothetical protein
MKVLIGVDPHKKSVNAVAAIDENGEIISHTWLSRRTGEVYKRSSTGRSGSPSVAGRLRVRPASGVPWRRSWLELAKRWWT